MLMNDSVKQSLEQLNFSEILSYKRPIDYRCRGDEIHTCTGFCHDCEDKGLASKCDSPEPLMSHGCTSDDFTKIIGQPLPEVRYDFPIMFLLENPGADYGNGQAKTFDGVTKNPPVNHFYFSSDLHQWPIDPQNDIRNPYGDYFAYLMAKFGLGNVYITNCIKCKYDKDYYNITADNCIKLFLEREIKLFQPRIIFCFGKQVANELMWKRIEKPGRLTEINFRKVRLLHPAARLGWKTIVQKNDTCIEETLNNFARQSS